MAKSKMELTQCRNKWTTQGSETGEMRLGCMVAIATEGDKKKCRGPIVVARSLVRALWLITALQSWGGKTLITPKLCCGLYIEGRQKKYKKLRFKTRLKLSKIVSKQDRLPSWKRARIAQSPAQFCMSSANWKPPRPCKYFFLPYFFSELDADN